LCRRTCYVATSHSNGRHQASPANPTFAVYESQDYSW
jgi:hypothetical protein